MINTEGNTLNVPELRRLVEDPHEKDEHIFAALVKAAPALLGVVEMAKAVVRDACVDGYPSGEYFHNNENGRALIRSLARLEGKNFREFERDLLDKAGPS